MEILLEPEEFKDAVVKVFKREGKKYNVPGFRKGHAPRNLIEKMYGQEIFYQDAANELFPKAYEDAVEETGIEPVSRPEAELLSMSAEDGAVVKVEVTVKPELKIGKYSGLKATRTVQTADEANVNSEIDTMREKNSRLITREGAAENGDIAELDYEGSVDGVPFDGGKDDNFKLNLGSGQFIDGFEEQIIGHKAGDEFDVNVTFPEKYHAENLAGKEAVFKVKLHEIQYKELPELDDEFAKDVSEYDTLDDLKKSIRDDMQKKLDDQADMEAENQLVEQIVETIEGEIPNEMYENRMDEMVQDFSFRLQQQGLNLETYLQYAGSDAQTFRESFREQAEKNVKMRLALETVVKMENITTSDEDIDEEVARIAEKYSMEPDQVRNLMPASEIAKDLAVNKAIDFVKSNATLNCRDIGE